MNRSLRSTVLYVVLVSVLSIPALSQGAGVPKISGFIPNYGQWPDEVRYVLPNDNLNVWVTKTGIVFDQFSVEDQRRIGHVLRLTWTDANTLERSFSKDVHAGTRVNVFGAASPGAWRNNMGLARSITFPNAWSGVDLVLYVDGANRFRYDFKVKPDADAKRIGFRVAGDRGMRISSDAVTLKTSVGEVNMTDLFAYVLGKDRLEVPATFTAASSSVRFSVPQWTGKVPLRIDPVVYGTYVGGTDDDEVVAVRYREDGVVIAGTTSALEFPKEVGAYNKDIVGARDVFVALMSKDLSNVLSYSFYGGGSDDEVSDMVLDKDGRPCFVGSTESSDLPVSSGAVGQLYKAKRDVFVAQLSADLSELNISTYLGGNNDDIANACAVDVNGSIFVAGMTLSDADFPVTLAHQQEYGGNEDAFLAKLSPSAGSFNFCTYFGKAGDESFTCLALDDGGAPIVSGYTSSSDFETAPRPGWFSSGRLPYDRTYNGGDTDAFLIKFFSDGTLSRRDDGTFSTFFGGDQMDEGRAIYVDGVGRPVLVGVTTSTDLPTEGALQVTPLGQQDIFMVMLSNDGRGLVSCTYYGGSGRDDVVGMIPDIETNSGFMYGTTNSIDFPIKGAGAQRERAGSTDGFISQINTATVVFSTLVGGVATDTVVSADIDENQDVYHSVTGPSPNLPVHESAWQDERTEGRDGYVAKWAMGEISIAAPRGGEDWCIGSRRTISWSSIEMGSEDTYLISVSADAGETWDTIATEIKQTNYNWDIQGYEQGDEYKVRIWSSRGHLIGSDEFSLTAPPMITSQPTGVNGCEGESVTISVEATGKELRYQWKRSGQNIPGANSPEFVIEELNSQTAGSYTVEVQGSCTPAARSDEIFVLMNLPTSVTSEPEDATAKTGEMVTFTVAAVGGELTYQWYKDEQILESATSATLTLMSVTSSDSGAYTCVVQGTCGDVTTREAILTIDATTSVDELDLETPQLTVLGPVPASESVAIRVVAPAGGLATLTIRNIGGSRVAQMSLGNISPGASEHQIPVQDLASGTYFMEIETGSLSLQATLRIAR